MLSLTLEITPASFEESKTVPARRRREMAVLIERHALALEIVAISIDVITSVELVGPIARRLQSS